MPPSPGRATVAAGDAHKGRSRLATIQSIVPYLWPEGRLDLKARIVIAMVALVLAKVATLAFPLFYGAAVDALGGNGQAVQAVGVAIGFILAFGVARILMQGFAQLRDAIASRAVYNAVRAVAGKTFRHIHALSLRFHLERKTGGLTRVIERGTKGIDILLFYVLFSIVPTVLELVLVCGYLWWAYHWGYVAITIVTVIIYGWFTIRVTSWRTEIRRRMNDSDTEANTKAVDSLLNYETVKYFNNEGHEASRYDQAMLQYADASEKSQMSLSFLNAGQAAIITIGLVGVMCLAAYHISIGQMTIGGLVVVNGFLTQLYVPLNLLGTVYREINQSLIDMEKMFDVLHVAPEVKDKAEASDLVVRGGEIRFEDVVFSYDPERTILKGVSFTVPAGKTVAIVGPSGAGKSTISRILYRFYEIGSGRVTIDGQDIRDVRQDSVRAAIGIVPQDTVLFNDTIRYNIKYGRMSASDAEVEEAARLAQIEPFIQRLPDGFKAMVGERGLKLSGGEKQRVAIARTILKNPPILLLDEATSALDTHTEREIQSALREVSRNRTTLVIAHRLSTVIDADQILVLDQGRIVERGRHEELLALNGAYAAMWNRQREAAEARARLKEVEADPATNPEAARVRPLAGA
ncbi:MAG: ABCB family ABC transporter ATP-binding protein/permease [Alphaproteobacteria bacterium]|jgi:ABC-type transport system involved in Fe-S cluster assembly fused permease/ATPase subunit